MPTANLELDDPNKLLPLPGIYDALRSGTTEASEGDLTQIRSLRLNEVNAALVGGVNLMFSPEANMTLLSSSTAWPGSGQNQTWVRRARGT